MGRFQYVNEVNQVDRYFPYEKPLMRYLDSLVIKRFKIKLITDSLNTYSKDLAVILNSYFDKKGMLIESSFKSPEEINSYLAGRYYRYGEMIDNSVFKIQVANSPNHKTCGTLLKKSGCTNINYKYLRNIPAQFIYIFKPTNQLKAYFAVITNQKRTLDNSFDESMKSLLGVDGFNKMVTYREKEKRKTLKTFK